MRILIICLIIIVSVWSIFLYPLTAFAALAIDEDFESYTPAGTDIGGGSGGSGWSSNWTKYTGGNTFPSKDTSGLSLEGSLAMQATAGNDPIWRDFTGISDNGSFSVMAHPTNTGAGCMIRVHDADTLLFLISFGANTSGQIEYYVSSYQNIQAFSANTTYTVSLEVDITGNWFKYKIDSGSWSSQISMGSPAEFDRIRFQNFNNTCYFDDITTLGGEAPAVTIDYSTFYIYIGWTEF